jgi:hypothetical protein
VSPRCSSGSSIGVAATEGSIAIPGCDGLTLDVDALSKEVDGVIAGGADDAGEERVATAARGLSGAGSNA